MRWLFKFSSCLCIVDAKYVSLLMPQMFCDFVPCSQKWNIISWTKGVLRAAKQKQCIALSSLLNTSLESKWSHRLSRELKTVITLHCFPPKFANDNALFKCSVTPIKEGHPQVLDCVCYFLQFVANFNWDFSSFYSNFDVNSKRNQR